MTAAIRAFSVPVTLGSSRKISAPMSCLASISYRSPTSTVAPSRSRARTWVSTRRRPITSPPGGGSWTEPNRASNGPARRIDARIRAQSSGSSGARLRVRASTRTWFGPVHSTEAPRCCEQAEHGFDVAYAGDVADLHRTVGQQRGGENGERRVLVARGSHGARERRAAADQKAFRHGGKPRGRPVPSSSGPLCPRLLFTVMTPSIYPALGFILEAAWVGPTMAISLIFIALAFLVIAAVAVLVGREAAQALQKLSDEMAELRAEIAARPQERARDGR